MPGNLINALILVKVQVREYTNKKKRRYKRTTKSQNNFENASKKMPLENIGVSFFLLVKNV